METKINKKTVIGKVAHGWDSIEPSIVAFVAARLPFMMQGKHGNAKTTIGKLLGHIYGDGSFRYYDCSKANLISMCGFPDAERMRAGEQAFVPNNRSLIGSEKHPVKVILLDEITRTPKDASNMLLEVIEGRSIFGIPTGHEVLIATANPSTYKGATKLDEALLDRFVACLPIPDYAQIESEDVKEMIRINVRQEKDPNFLKEVGQELKELVLKVRAKYESFLKDEDTTERIGAYCANLVSLCKNKWGEKDEPPYISGREASNQLWKAIIALASYYIVKYDRDERQAFVEAAERAIEYCWIVKHAMQEKHSRVVLAIHKDMKFLLIANGKGAAGKVQIAYATAITPQAKIAFWEQNLSEVIKHCDASMKQEMMSGTLECIEQYNPVTAGKKANISKDVLTMRAKLYGIAKQDKDFVETSDSLEGSLVCELISGMNATNASVQTEPYSTIAKGPKMKASDIVDILMLLSGGNIDGNMDKAFKVEI